MTWPVRNSRSDHPVTLLSLEPLLLSTEPSEFCLLTARARCIWGFQTVSVGRRRGAGGKGPPAAESQALTKPEQGQEPGGGGPVASGEFGRWGPGSYVAQGVLSQEDSWAGVRAKNAKSSFPLSLLAVGGRAGSREPLS